MTSLTKLSGGFTQEDLNNLRVFRAVTSVGCAVLFQVFQWGCQNKSTGKTLEEYLLQDKNMEKKLFRKLFNKTMLHKIRSNPSCDQFDISLLLVAIKVACEGVASRDNDMWITEDAEQLEYNLTLLKKERNEVAHDVKPISEVQMKEKFEEIRNLLVRIITQSCIRFTISSVTEKKNLDDIHRLLDNARDQPLSGSEMMQLHKQLQVEHIIYIIKHKGSEELRQKYKSLSYITPLSFIDGSNIMIDVESIFSDIEIAESGRNNTGESIKIDDLLQLHDYNNDPLCLNILGTRSITIVDGCAGAGKTTLTKMLMSEWSKPSTTMKQLLDYDLVLLMECRNSYINSLSELFENLMPNTFAMTQDNITRCARNLKILFLVDGLDELNKSSNKLFSEIVEICRTGDHNIFCTTRPEKLKDLYKMISGKLELSHLHINGIPIEARSNFVKNYMTHLKLSKTISTELIEYIDKSPARLKEFYRFPLNLVLLTYLWAMKQGEVKNIMTTTELYQEIINLMVEKLLERLKHHDSTRDICVADLKAKVLYLLSELFRQALLSLKNDEILINETSSQRLTTLCSDLGLPAREALSAFLVMKVVWTRTGSEEQLSFPHKDIHDYFAAKCLYMAITDAEFCSVLKNSYLKPAPRKTVWKTFFGSSRPKIIHELIESLLETSLDSNKLIKFQNIFKHLAGLLHDESASVNDQECEETVELLSKSGFTNKGLWLDVLGEVKCNQKIARYIAIHVFKRSVWIRDDRIQEFLCLMHTAIPRRVTLNLSSDPDDLPGLMELLREITKQECEVNLYLHHHFRHPTEDKTSDKFLKCLQTDDARCRVREVMGYLSGDYVPRVALTRLFLAVVSDEHARALQSLVTTSYSAAWYRRPHFLHRNNNNEIQKGVHVVPGVSPEALTGISLSATNNILRRTRKKILLSCHHITDGQVEWVSDVAKVLTQNESLGIIQLPESQLSRQGCEDLIDSLAERGTRVTGRGKGGGGLWVSSPHLSDDNRAGLDERARVKLGCDLFLYQSKRLGWEELAFKWGIL